MTAGGSGLRLVGINDDQGSSPRSWQEDTTYLPTVVTQTGGPNRRAA